MHHIYLVVYQTPLRNADDKTVILNCSFKSHQATFQSKVLDLPIRHCRPSEDIVPFSECHNNFKIRSYQTVHASPVSFMLPQYPHLYSCHSSFCGVVFHKSRSFVDEAKWGGADTSLCNMYQLYLVFKPAFYFPHSAIFIMFV